MHVFQIFLVSLPFRVLVESYAMFGLHNHGSIPRDVRKADEITQEKHGLGYREDQTGKKENEKKLVHLALGNDIVPICRL